MLWILRMSYIVEACVTVPVCYQWSSMAATTSNVATNVATGVDVQMQVSHTPGGTWKVSDFQEEAQQVLAREDQALLVRHCRHHASHVTTASGVQKANANVVFLGTAVCLKIVSNPKCQDIE